MSAPSHVVAYVYDKDILCTECVLDDLVANNNRFPAELNLNRVPIFEMAAEGHYTESILDVVAIENGIDRSDPNSYSSDWFPEPVSALESQLFPATCCGRCHKRAW